MTDLVPSAEELAELQQPVASSPEELLMEAYDELLRDKRSEEHLPCYQWHDEACHCHEVRGSGHTAPVHPQRGGRVWCVAHQSVECDEVHPHITFEQFKKRHLSA